MRAATVLMLVVLLLASSGCSQDAERALSPGNVSDAPVLALTERPNGGARLAWLDPGTLGPLERRFVQLSGGVWSPVLAVDGARVALGGRGNEGIRIVDVAHMMRLSRVARASPDRSLVPIDWPLRRRLLALEFEWMQGPSVSHVQDLLVIDPVASRVVARRPLDGWAIQTIQVGRRVVLLLQPAVGIGPARLAVVGPDGAVRIAILRSVLAGSDEESSEGGQARNLLRMPALAVDPDSRRAFVVPGGTHVVEVQLATLEVSDHELSAPASLLSRLRDWLEPAADAKAPPIGPLREAQWLGNGLLASTGWNGLRPAGISLIDVERDTVRTIDEAGARFSFEGGILLAYGDYSSSDGIRAYSLGGDALWKVLEGEAIGEVRVLGGRVYVELASGRTPLVAVFDLASGTEIKRVTAPFPEFVRSPLGMSP
jgi:hypothetical protein